MSNISVIIPSYNHKLYIQQAVESVLAQSYDKLELIVIDDGSTDNSLDYLRSVRDKRFRLVEQRNEGAHNAINRGLILAQGEFISILNSDDIFHPDRLKICMAKLLDGIDLVSTWIEVIDSKGKGLGVKMGWHNMLPWAITPPQKRIESINPYAVNLLQTNFVSTTSNIVFSRNIYDSIGGMENLRFAHDWDFLLRAVCEFKCELIEIPLLKYRIHSSNTISSNRAWMLFEICWIYATHLKKVLQRLQDESAGSITNEDIIEFMGNSLSLQGNDKVMWMLLQYMDNWKENGNQHPERLLLVDEGLRNEFISFIQC